MSEPHKMACVRAGAHAPPPTAQLSNVGNVVVQNFMLTAFSLVGHLDDR